MRITFVKNCVTVGVLLFLIAVPFFAATTLQLISVFPSAGATQVSVDTPLRFTFNGPPMLSQSGTMQIVDDAGVVVDSIDVSSRTRSKTIGGLPNFSYYPIIITGNEVVVAFQNNILSYGKTYEVRVSAGLFVDKDGNAARFDAAKIGQFSTRPAAPALSAEGPRRIVVAAEARRLSLHPVWPQRYEKHRSWRSGDLFEQPAPRRR